MNRLLAGIGVCWFLVALLGSNGLSAQSRTARQTQALNHYVDFANECLHFFYEMRLRLEEVNRQALTQPDIIAPGSLDFQTEDLIQGYRLRTFLQGGCARTQVTTGGKVEVDLQVLYRQTPAVPGLSAATQATLHRQRDELWYLTLELKSLADSLSRLAALPNPFPAHRVYDELAQAESVYQRLDEQIRTWQELVPALVDPLPVALRPMDALAKSAELLVAAIREGHPPTIRLARANLQNAVSAARQARTDFQTELGGLGLWFEEGPEQAYDHVVEYGELLLTRTPESALQQISPRPFQAYPARYHLYNERVLAIYNHHKYGLISYLNQFFAMADAPYRRLVEAAPWFQLIPPTMLPDQISLPAEPSRDSIQYSLTNAPTNNLVFLIDVSGSMNRPGKLPLIKENLQFLVSLLRPEDQVSIVTFAEGAYVPLATTSGTFQTEINQAIQALRTGGDTRVQRGFKEAFKMAEGHYVPGGNNRILLFSDGVFEVSSQVESTIRRGTEAGITLSVLYLGNEEANQLVERLSQLASLGNGRYGHLREDNAKSLLVAEAQSFR